MNKKKLIYQLFPSYLSIIIIAVLALILFTNKSLENFYYKEKAETLEARAILFGHLISSEKLKDINYLTELCQELGQATGTRITLISPSGKVLGDSHENPEIMTDHGDRPEVIKAYKGKTSMSIRYSHTLDQKMMYLAVPLKLDDVTIIVRTSLPLTLLKETLSDMRKKTIFGGLIIALIAALVNLVVSRRIAHPLEEIERGARRFASGELDHRLSETNTAEIASLAGALNQMAQQLDIRIKTILRQGNEQKAILSSMLEGVIAVDREEKIININSAAANLFKIDRSAVLNKSIQESIRNTELYHFIADVLSGKNNIETELIFSTHRSRYLKVTGTIMQGENGDQIGALIVLNDMTEIRQLEKVRQEFVANVSHELKTPITSIKGFVETLQDGAKKDPKELERFLDVIFRQAKRLNAIIDDLLELSRIEQQEGKISISLELQPVFGILEAAVQDCRVQIDKKQIKVVVDCDESLNAAFNAAFLRQAVKNLIDNAVKYSKVGHLINIIARQDENSLIIKVQDFGIGIDEEHFEHLFERFYRVDKARSRKLGGTGLGLAIVKHIAQVHGGSVSVKSKMDEGSTFSIRIPNNLTDF